MRCRKLKRRGITTAQMAVMLALITLAIVAAVRTLGTNARTRMNSTATGIGTPSQLPNQFGS